MLSSITRRSTADGMRQSEPGGNVRAAVVADDREALVAERAHHPDDVLCHRALGVRTRPSTIRRSHAGPGRRRDGESRAARRPCARSRASADARAAARQASRSAVPDAQLAPGSAVDVSSVKPSKYAMPGETYPRTALPPRLHGACYGYTPPHDDPLENVEDPDRPPAGSCSASRPAGDSRRARKAARCCTRRSTGPGGAGRARHVAVT